MVPETTFSLAAAYTFDTACGQIIPRLSYYYRNTLFTGIDFRAIDFDNATIDPQGLWNARLQYLPNDQLRLSAYVNNLSDEQYFKSGFSVSASLGAATLAQGPARHWGIELEYRFF